jgi:FkbM family methyltransferase
VKPHSRAKRFIKAARDHPALNLPVTASVRAGLRLSGREAPWVTKHLPRVGTVRMRLPNGAQLKLWSRGDDWIPTQIYWRGMYGYEPETAYLFFWLAQRAATTINVGAYVGYFAVMAALANPAGTVVAVEPYPPTFERLQRNLKLNRLANVVCRNVAAGALAGTGPLYYFDKGLPSAASLVPSHLAPWGPTQMPVPIIRLDDLVGELGLPRVDLIMVDAEGSEVDVLAGAAGILSRDRPHVICEVLPAARQDPRLADQLEPLGYRFYELGPDGPEERSEISRSRFSNYLFSVSPLPELSAGPQSRTVE